jgi:hypothetical protein
MPGETPVTIPPFVSVAIDGDSTSQEPPNTGDNDVLCPTHIVSLETATVGGGFTIKLTPLLHPVDADVNIMDDCPWAIPVTNPVRLLTEATFGLEEDHKPWPGLAEAVIAPPIQIDVFSRVTIGKESFNTSYVLVALQPPDEDTVTEIKPGVATTILGVVVPFDQK